MDKDSEKSAPVARAAAPVDLNGFVIFVNRTRMERRDGKPFARTVGSYHVTYQGEKLPDLEGTTVEREGPGDNSMSGVEITVGSRRAPIRSLPMGALATNTKPSALPSPAVCRSVPGPRLDWKTPAIARGYCCIPQPAT